MKILNLLPKLPWPAVDGASIAVYNQLHGLSRLGVEWIIACFISNRHAQDLEGFRQYMTYSTEGRFPEMRWTSALASLFQPLPYNLSLRFDSDDFRRMLTVIREDHPRFDLIQLEWANMGLYLSDVRALWPDAPVVLRQHNVEHLLLQRMADRQRNPLKRWFAGLQADRMKRFERQLLANVDHIIALTVQDRDAFRRLCPDLPATAIPAGLDAGRYSRPSDLPRDDRFLIIGSLSWEPYAESVRWFVNEVWIPFHDRHPSSLLTLVGADPPADLRVLDGRYGMEVTGFRDDVMPEFHRAKAMLLPLRSGSGMRVKAIEAAVSHLPIITTDIGVEGLPFHDDKECLIASTPSTWWHAMERLSDPDTGRRLAEAAYAAAADRYSVESVSIATLDLFRSLTGPHAGRVFN